MSEHSPGPWRVNTKPWLERLQNGKSKWHWTVCGPNGDTDTNIARCASNAMAIDNEANARLIAAAPEILEALTEAFYCLTSQPCDPHLLTEMIIPALKKATGASPPSRIPVPFREPRNER